MTMAVAVADRVHQCPTECTSSRQQGSFVGGQMTMTCVCSGCGEATGCHDRRHGPVPGQLQQHQPEFVILERCANDHMHLPQLWRGDGLP